MKKFWFTGVAVAAVMIIGAPSAAYADRVPETTVTEFDHWQRYSHKGAWHSNTEAPPFPGNWQANTKSDPHNIGVPGAYYRSNGNSGKGDWFYLEAVTKTVTIPAKGNPTKEVPNPGYVEAYEETIFHEAIECPVNPVDPVEPVDPEDPLDPVDPVEPVEPEQPIEPEDETTEPGDTVQKESTKPERVAAQEQEEGRTPVLAETGASDVLPLAFGGGLLILAGAAMMTRKNNA